jgi:hypothetical protein
MDISSRETAERCPGPWTLLAKVIFAQILTSPLKGDPASLRRI